MSTTTQPQKAGAIVAVGYVLAVIMPLVGFIVGIVVATRPEKPTSKHGAWIITTSVVAFLLWLVILTGSSPQWTHYASNPTPQTQTQTQTATNYPASVQTGYLNACENTDTTSNCQCELSQLEQTTSLDTIVAYQPGTMPSWLLQAVQTCVGT